MGGKGTLAPMADLALLDGMRVLPVDDLSHGPVLLLSIDTAGDDLLVDGVRRDDTACTDPSVELRGASDSQPCAVFDSGDQLDALILALTGMRSEVFGEPPQGPVCTRS